MRKIHSLILTLLTVPFIVSAADPTLQVINVSTDPAMVAVRVELGDSVLNDSLVFNSATPFMDVPAGADTLYLTSLSNTAVQVKLFVAPSDDMRYQSILYGVFDTVSYAANPDGQSLALAATWVAVDTSGLAADRTRVNFFLAVSDAVELDVADLLLEYIVDDMSFGEYSSDATDFPQDQRSIFFTSTDSVTTIASRSADLSVVAGPSATIFLSGYIVPINNQDGPSIQFYVAGSDGQVTPLSLLLHVPINELAANILVYPNPASDFVRLEFTTREPGDLGISLVGLNGRTHFSKNHFVDIGDHQLQFELPDVPAGLYFLRMDTGDSSAALPVVIQH